jgi:hypothetical protein
MDKLEDYIRKNRDELNKHPVSPEIWRGIERRMQRGRSFYIKWISAAATIVIIMTTAVFFYNVERNNRAVSSEMNINEFVFNNTILSETEIYYNNQVNTLYREAAPILSLYPDIEKELDNDLFQLDSICSDIKKDLRDNIANQEVIEALINNYRLKIKILEDMLDQVKQSEASPGKKENHEL